tara:strand:- start:8900 stop:9817 length:918 start_codon:yes stop_codon:yes gene_type:complete
MTEVNTTQTNQDGIKSTGNVLVHYGTHRAPTTVTHRPITDHTCATTGADPKSLRTVARLFESKDTPVGRILSLFAKTRVDISRCGLKLPTGGYLVRASKLEQIRKLYDEADDELERQRGELRIKFPALIAQSKLKLGTAADGIEFPDPEETAGKFSHQLDYTPDPTAGAIVLDGVAEEVAAKVRAQADKTRDNSLRDAHAGLIKELLGFVTGNGKDVGILGVLGSDCTIKSGRFNGLAKRLEEARDLNYLNLPEVNEVIDALKPLATADLDSARADDGERRKLEVQAKGLVSSTTKALASLGVTL